MHASSSQDTEQSACQKKNPINFSQKRRVFRYQATFARICIAADHEECNYLHAKSAAARTGEWCAAHVFGQRFAKRYGNLPERHWQLPRRLHTMRPLFIKPPATGCAAVRHQALQNAP
jgi:hypothetical protein